MKPRTIIILSLFSAATALIAATLTIEIPANDIPRVAEAFGQIYNLGRPANVNEVQYFTKQWIIQTTKDYERRKNAYEYAPPPLEMQPSPTPTSTPGTLAAPQSKTKKK